MGLLKPSVTVLGLNFSSILSSSHPIQACHLCLGLLSGQHLRTQVSENAQAM